MRARARQGNVALADTAQRHVKVLDANTKKHRTSIDIEIAAKLRTVESGTYPRFRRVEACAGTPYTGDDDIVMPTHARRR